MKRTLSAALTAALLVTVSLTAQSPKGWMVRADRSTSASDPDGAGAIKFVTMGTGFHATNPQAAVYWNPANTMSGNYTVKGTFTLVKPSGHTNYYGLVSGGSNYDGAKQAYTYFLVAQDGSWLVKHRNGEAATDVLPKAPSDAVKKPGADGKSTHALNARRRRQDRLRRQRHRRGIIAQERGEGRRDLRHPREPPARGPHRRAVRRKIKSASPGLNLFGDLLRVGPDAEKVAAPDLPDLLFRVAAPHQLQRHVERFRRAVPAVDAAAAVEV